MNPLLRTGCLILSLAGASLSLLLLGLHHEAVDPRGDLSGICGTGGGCHDVLSSRWAYFPPLPDQADPVLKVPVALLGVAYFSTIAVWFGAFGWSSGVSKGLDRVVMGTLAAGAAGSLGCIGLMALVLRSACPWCLATHLVNFILVGVAALGYFGRNRQALSGPDRRIPVMAALLVAALWISAGLASQWLSARSRLGAVEASLAEIEKEAGVLEMAFYGQEPLEISLREDGGAEGWDRDPTRDASPGYRNTLVVFGDAQCSACRRFHELLEAEILPAYGSHLRVVFKHLPLADLHPDAFRAALALEAARAQGKFWPMLEALYDRQAELGSLTYPALAVQLGLDEDRFAADMESAEARGRVQEDLELAERLGIDSTPAVFLNGRRVSGAIRSLAGFWQSQADRLKAQREEKGLPWEAGQLAGGGEDR